MRMYAKNARKAAMTMAKFRTTHIPYFLSASMILIGKV